MLACPFCERPLSDQHTDGWLCKCGETIPFGLEKDSNENCETCPVLYCPRRIRPQRIPFQS